MRFRPLALGLAMLSVAVSLAAETGYDAWLRYAAIDDAGVRQRYVSLPASVVVFGDSPVLRAAQGELVRGVRGMLARTLRSEDRLPPESAVALGTVDAIGKTLPTVRLAGELPADGYWLKTVAVGWFLRVPVAEWAADDTFPTRRIDAHSSTRRTIAGLALRPGDEIRIEAFPDGGEGAPLDYVEIRAQER